VAQTISSSFRISVKSAFAAVPPWIWFIQIMLTSFFSMYFFVLLADFSGSTTSTVSYVAIGNAVQSIAVVSMYSIAMIPGTQKHMETLPAMMQTPSSMYMIFVGMSIFSILSGFFSVGISLVYAAIFGVSFSMVNVLSIVVVVLLTALSMSSIGMAIGSIGIYLRTSMILASIMAYIGLVIAGVNFPVDALPGWVQIFSAAYPLTYAVKATRLSIDGVGLGGMIFEVGMMLLLSFIFIVISIVMFRYFERLSRKNGKLDHF